MAVRPGPKIFGEIKTIWEPWLLSFRGSWRGAVQAWLTGLQEAGRRVPGAACSLVVIRAVCEGRVAHFSKQDPGGKKERKRNSLLSALSSNTSL